MTAMKNNGSPAPLFETDEDRTWFRVTLPIHPAFDPNAQGEFLITPHIEQKLALLIKGLVVSDHVDDQVVIMMVRLLLFLEDKSRSKTQLLERIRLKNHNDNVKRYIEPLEINNIITKTIPEKPKSPKQEYRLTEKGKLLLQKL